MRYSKFPPLLLGLCVFGLGHAAKASPVLEDDENGSGLLRVANQPDQGLTQASIRFGASGRFHLTTEGTAPQDFRGIWHNTAPGVYDLQVTQGFGLWGATGSGRAIFTGGELQEFEIAGVSTGEPFYLSFGTGGYADPYPGVDGFALGLSLDSGWGYYYGLPNYYNYGRYSDGRGRGNWGGRSGRPYSNYPGNHGYPQAGGAVDIGQERGYAPSGPANRGPQVIYRAQPPTPAQQFNNARQFRGTQPFSEGTMRGGGRGSRRGGGGRGGGGSRGGGSSRH